MKGTNPASGSQDAHSRVSEGSNCNIHLIEVCLGCCRFQEKGVTNFSLTQLWEWGWFRETRSN